MTDEYQIITLSTQLPFVNDAMYIICTDCTVVANAIATARLEIGME